MLLTLLFFIIFNCLFSFQNVNIQKPSNIFSADEQNLFCFFSFSIQLNLQAKRNENHHRIDAIEQIDGLPAIRAFFITKFLS